MIVAMWDVVNLHGELVPFFYISVKGVQAGPSKNPKIVRFPFPHYSP